MSPVHKILCHGCGHHIDLHAAAAAEGLVTCTVASCSCRLRPSDLAHYAIHDAKMTERAAGNLRLAEVEEARNLAQAKAVALDRELTAARKPDFRMAPQHNVVLEFSDDPETGTVKMAVRLTDAFPSVEVSMTRRQAVDLIVQTDALT